MALGDPLADLTAPEQAQALGCSSSRWASAALCFATTGWRGETVDAADVAKRLRGTA